jgi:hypothetical protein
VLDQARPHLLTVDEVAVAVADGAGTQRGEIGAGLGLRVADGEMDLARRDPRQVELPLLRGAEPHDGRADRVDGQEWHRYPGGRGLVGEDELVHRGHSAAAVLPRPAQGEPAVAAEPADDVPVRRAVTVLTVGRVERLAQGRGHEVGEVGPQYPPELLLLGRVADVHTLPPQELN